MQYYTNLVDATKAALIQAKQELVDGDIYAVDHLMAQKRENGTWCVRISDFFDAPFLTHLSDKPHDCEGEAEDVAARIVQMWNEDWTEVQADGPVGDFSYGSSDWK